MKARINPSFLSFSNWKSCILIYYLLMDEEENVKVDSVEELAEQLDSMLERWQSPISIMNFLTAQHSAKALDIVYASLLSDRMFNLDFILKTNPGYASFLVKLLPSLDPYTRTHCIWQILQCKQSKWANAGFSSLESDRLRNLARNFLTGRDMDKHPYTGSMTAWLEPFDECFFDSDISIAEASSRIPDKCFGEFDTFVKSSLWLGRIYQADFFAISSLAKQVQMHANLDKIPVLVMLKFVAQVLHSRMDKNIKLAFWKKANELDALGDDRTFHSFEAIGYICKRCFRCRPLFEAMFQFPKLYDKIYEAKFSRNIATAQLDWIEQRVMKDIPLARKLIDEYSSFAEVALNLTLNGESITSSDVEYMLSKKKFNMVGEMVKDSIDIVSEVISPMEILFLILKYVKPDLCIECLESFEMWKPGFISECRDYYGNNALWFLLHRDPTGTRKKCKYTRDLKDILVNKYKCDPDEENIYGLSWKKVFKMKKMKPNEEQQ